MLDKFTALLSPAQRKVLYGILATLGTIAVVLGWANQVQVDAWVTLVISVAGLAGTVLAMIKAKSVDWKVVYAAAGVVLVAVKSIGWVDDQLETQVNQVLGAAAVAIPMIIAFIRTDTSVATGQPAQELANDVAQQELASPPLPAPEVPAVEPDLYDPQAPVEPADGYGGYDERGDIPISGLLVTVTCVLLCIAAVIFIVQAL